MSIRVDRACDVTLCAAVDPVDIPGRWDRRDREPAKRVDGSMRWESHGALSTCGAAYSTELLGVSDAGRETEGGELQRLSTAYSFRARAGRWYRLRQLTSLVPDTLHHEPDRQAIRLVHFAGGARLAGDAHRESPRLGITLASPRSSRRRFAALAGAGRRSLLLPPLLGAPLLALEHVDVRAVYRPDPHNRGHVMWDIEAFALPPLLLTDPDAARSLLDFRASRLRGRLR